jgi:hypothetical protein
MRSKSSDVTAHRLRLTDMIRFFDKIYLYHNWLVADNIYIGFGV